MKKYSIKKLLPVFAGFVFGLMIFGSVSLFVRQLAPSAINCQIDSFVEGGPAAEKVPVSIVSGNEYQLPDESGKLPMSVDYEGVNASVTYNRGDSIHTQTYLVMVMTDSSGNSVDSVMYDYKPRLQLGPINVLQYRQDDKHLRLQCGVDNPFI